MEPASLQLVFTFIGILVGIAIGAFGYRLLSPAQRRISGMQLDLLESERRVAELKADMQGHLGDTRLQVESARTALDSLEQRLRQQAAVWGLADHHWVAHDTDPMHAAAHEPVAESRPAAAEPATPPSDASTDGTAKDDAPRDDAPKDYAADGQGGTLSEEFGLKKADDETAEAPQPPRY